MAIYNSDAQFYSVIKLLFEQMRTQNPNPIDQLSTTKLLVRLRFFDPHAEILVNGRLKPVKIQYGLGKLPVMPDLDAEMAMDTLHEILIQNLSLKSAIANKKLKVAGAIWKTNSLGAILNHGQALYPGILRNHGLL